MNADACTDGVKDRLRLAPGGYGVSPIELALAPLRRLAARESAAEIVEGVLTLRTLFCTMAKRLGVSFETDDDLVFTRHPVVVLHDAIARLQDGKDAPEVRALVVVGLLAALAADDRRDNVEWVTMIGRRTGLPRLAELASKARLIAEAPVTEGPDPLSADPRTDVPTLTPPVPVRGVWAGVTRAHAEVWLPHPIHEGMPMRYEAEASVEVELPPEASGAHMSRMQTALLEVGSADSLLAAAVILARRARLDQLASAARVGLSTRHFIRVAGETSGTPIETSITVEEIADAMDLSSWEEAKSTIRLPVSTACPCTATYSRLRAAAAAPGVSGLPPTFSHMQPGTLEVSVTDAPDRLPSFRTLFDICSGVAHLRRSVLKRPMEHQLVEEVHKHTQFSEDLTRAAALSVASELEPTTLVEVRVEMAESIHPHFAVATIKDWAYSLWQTPSR